MLNSRKHAVVLHIPHGRASYQGPCLLFVVIVRQHAPPPHPPLHSELELLVEVQRVRPHERRVVPGVRPGGVPKIRHVEEAGPAPRREEDLLLVGWVAIHEQPFGLA